MIFGLLATLPFAVCLFWAVQLLLDWRRDNVAQHVLVAFMATSALLYLCHSAFFYHEVSLADISECIYAFCNIAVFPLYYLYICRLTSRRDHTRGGWHPILMLTPAIAIGLWAIILHIFFPDNARYEEVRVSVMRVVFVVQLIPICWRGYQRLRDFDNEIANFYSDTANREVRPTIRMMMLLVGGTLISVIANFLGREYFDSSVLLLAVPSILFTVLLYGVGYVGLRQEFSIDDLIKEEGLVAAEPVPEEIQETSPIDKEETPEVSSNIISELDKVMNEQQLYLNPDLRLSEVAALLGVGRTTLSQRINKELHMTFSTYVNNLRVDNACALLESEESKRMSLAGVAEASGFSSDSSFYRAFRLRTGKTPKEYSDTCG